MMNSYRIARIAGIDIRIHTTWVLVFILFTWSLSRGLFPELGFSQAESWLAGILTTVFLYISVIVHELSHSLVSKSEGSAVDSITLFFFGGVASIGPENLKPGSEFRMAIAGPIMSFIISGAFFVIYSFLPSSLISAITEYLFRANLMLGIFNLAPGFPLDGGRILRSMLWKFTGDLKKATRIASYVGMGLGYLMMAGGFALMLSQGFGLWYILLGAFLVFLAKAGYSEVLFKEELEKMDPSSVIARQPLINPAMTLQEFMWWTIEQDSVVGVAKDRSFYIVDAQEVKQVPQELWNQSTVKDIMKKVSPVSVKNSLFRIFSDMRRNGWKAVPVTRNSRYVGVIREADIMNVGF